MGDDAMPKTDQDNVSNESSRLLLKPSSCSTERPSASNLQDYEEQGLIGSSSEIQLERLANYQLYDGASDYHDRDGTSRWQKKAKWIAAGALLLLFTGSILNSVLRPEPKILPTPTKNTSRSFSSLDPVRDLGLADYDRPADSKPSKALTRKLKTGRKNYPTNSWYQNMLMLQGRPSQVNRVNAIPYVLDAAGPIPGLRVHPNRIESYTTEFHLSLLEFFGLTLGAAPRKDMLSNTLLSFEYSVLETTPLGLTLEWEAIPMVSSIVRGMPYATMEYKDWEMQKDTDDMLLPTIASEIKLAKAPVADGSVEISCMASNPAIVQVNREVELTFKDSDFTWLVFTSEPVNMRCTLDESTGMVFLQVVNFVTPSSKDNVDRTLVLRAALMTFCSSGINPSYCRQEEMDPSALFLGQGNYAEILRKHAGSYPGRNTAFSFSVDDDSGLMELKFDWNVQRMAHYSYGNDTDTEFVALALPHHFEMLQDPKVVEDKKYCATTLLGPACMVMGSTWKMVETIPLNSFRAARSPGPKFLSAISRSLKYDLSFTLPTYYRRGAGDTYFSGKMLAKLGRIVLVAEELMDLCNSRDSAVVARYGSVCRSIWVPTRKELQTAVDELKRSVEVWINGKAETPFVYDSAWGGVVSCGCLFENDGCVTQFPSCPGFDIPGLNFGNAYYNDMHFHYGYHIFGAAVAAHFDPEWGRNNFENVLLLIRTIANPDDNDEFFIAWRQKDWYQGHSWASGIVATVLNGRNQESSSESIAAYEAVALYGKAMLAAWKEKGNDEKVAVAKSIEEAGLVATASEVRSTKRYWHGERGDESVKIFPESYKPHVVGIMWQTMAQFQTWFGNIPYLTIGIQLMPFTPIVEERDGADWLKEVYPGFAASCESDQRCGDSGWKVLQLGLLAGVGHKESAAEQALALDEKVFEDPGGNGHSRSNTLWFIATRPEVAEPLVLADEDKKPEISHADKAGKPGEIDSGHCGRPLTCTNYVLDTIANVYSCRQRMKYLVTNSMAPKVACAHVALEYPKECGACNPFISPDAEVPPARCPPCTPQECASDLLNRCPAYESTFVCTGGANVGGCSGFPWELQQGLCNSCCELTTCPPKKATMNFNP